MGCTLELGSDNLMRRAGSYSRRPIILHGPPHPLPPITLAHIHPFLLTPPPLAAQQQAADALSQMTASYNKVVQVSMVGHGGGWWGGLGFQGESAPSAKTFERQADVYVSVYLCVYMSIDAV